jgi:hypothetical protein
MVCPTGRQQIKIEIKIGIIIASNYDVTPISHVLDRVVDILLGFEPEVPKKSVLSYFRRIMQRDGIEAAKDAYYKLTKTIMQGHGYCNHRWKWEG